MGLEIERRYLVVNDQWRKLADIGQPIVQGYLCASARRTVRVRICGSDAFVTIMGAGMGIVRQEFEYPIPEPDARQIIEALCGTRVISKWRYGIKHGSQLWEIDVFDGHNQGLVVAGIELTTAAESFSKPDWVGSEVSGDPRYLSSLLVDRPWLEWG